ncbi:ribosomal protection-like ABC-F family protein [Inquilinus sp. CAU 1745]|uniref:ribosomal protection-like ABC-F family protein n=1 Tax=Inquilinus sp. CAU 1745 TaxID=3140369 RepID=UPI00325B27FC
MLQINDLTYRIGARTLFDEATVAVHEGHRVGLVGPNGTGKTTLLRLILGTIASDGGSIAVPQRWRIGTVAQEAPDGDRSLLETVLAADKERASLLADAETATDPHRIAEIHTRLADIEAHAAPARAGAILSGLGFDDSAQARPCREFSGGMRMRVALAATLFTRPDLLLLDEPTNHLDLEAALWLEGFLKSYPATMLMVSHDRGLLNRVVDTTIHLDNGKLISYAGGYDQFERTRRMKLEHLAAQQTKQLAQRRHMQAFIDRFRYKASKARQAQSRIKALERMEPIASVADERTVTFDFPSPEPLSPPLLTLEGVKAGYGEKIVLSGLSLRLDGEDRIALLGANGNGKSTFVKLLGDRLKPLDGTVRKSSKLKVGYFAQHQTEELDTRLTALAQAMAWMKPATEEKVRAHLGRFGFPQKRAETKIADMSGGEKARLLFALVSRDAPHILLLDEPTNHLDVDSRQALVQAINAYEGAVVLITHDPHLIELTADRLWLVADGTVSPFDGDIDDYRKLLNEQRRQERAELRAEKTDGADIANRKDVRRAAAENRAAQAPLRRRAKEAEALIAKLERERAALEGKLADSGLYDGPPEKVTELQIRLHETASRIAEAEESWLAAQEALEATG